MNTLAIAAFFAVPIILGALGLVFVSRNSSSVSRPTPLRSPWPELPEQYYADRFGPKPPPLPASAFVSSNPAADEPGGYDGLSGVDHSYNPSNAPRFRAEDFPLRTT